MMREDDVIAAILPLHGSDLAAWIREALVRPQSDTAGFIFTDMDCARVRLICTLHYDLEIDRETLPVVLSLLDQLYETRWRLQSLAAAVAAQDKTVQESVVSAVASARERSVRRDQMD